MPGQNKEIKQLGDVYYEQGIYATENNFYAFKHLCMLMDTVF